MGAEKLRIGEVISGSPSRDAIHVAVAPVVAARDLLIGQHVGINSHGEADPSATPLVGVVDPYLLTRPKAGQKFWLFLYPGSITSLRHDWTHAEFEREPEPKAEPEDSEAWLRNFVELSDSPSYELLVAAAAGEPAPDEEGYGRAYENDGEYLHFNGRDAHGEIPDEFWDHVEVVTGKKIPGSRRARYFSCGC